MIHRLQIPNDTAHAIRRGHPWVFRDRPYRAPVGAMVDLADESGHIVGWGLYDDGPIAVRVFGRGPAGEGMPAVLAERIERADRARRRIIDAETDAYRVVNGEGDSLPGLVLDRYGEVAVLRLYSSAWDPWLGAIESAVRELAWPTTLFRRFGVGRVDEGERGGVTLFGTEPASRIIVRECGMRLLARPHVGQKTGLFLDQREHRALVRRWAAGRRVLNLFAYTGGFSVAAALGGAARVVTVDRSADAIEDARENFRLNGLDPEEHEFLVEDVFGWAPHETVDFLIIDPPSLSRDRSTEASARRAYRRLHERLAGFVVRDGLLATSSCTARLSLDGWRQILVEALAGCGDWSWCWMSAEPPDHPVAAGHTEGRYLKFALLRKR